MITEEITPVAVLSCLLVTAVLIFVDLLTIRQESQSRMSKLLDLFWHLDCNYYWQEVHMREKINLVYWIVASKGRSITYQKAEYVASRLTRVQLERLYKIYRKTS